MRKILVTGALGQIGAELVPALWERHGKDVIVASDVRALPAGVEPDNGRFEHLDCTKLQQIQEVVRRNDVGTIYHLAALLSAAGEERPQTAWDLNMGSLYRVLEVARQYGCSLFFPQFNRRVWAYNPAREHAARHHPTPNHHLRCDQGRW